MSIRGQKILSYADAAVALGMEEAAVRVAIHRLRKRYRQLFTDEIAQTLSDSGQVDAECRRFLPPSVHDVA